MLHRCDRAMIYVFIAGSYTPWLWLKTFSPPGGAAEKLREGIWALAAAGIAYQQVRINEEAVVSLDKQLFGVSDLPRTLQVAGDDVLRHHRPHAGIRGL